MPVGAWWRRAGGVSGELVVVMAWWWGRHVGGSVGPCGGHIEW